MIIVCERCVDKNIKQFFETQKRDPNNLDPNKISFRFKKLKKWMKTPKKIALKQN
jgi:hypothetical protein